MIDSIPLAVDAVQAVGPTIGYGLKVGLGTMGAAIGVGLVGFKAAEAVGRNPGAFGKVLTLGILGMAFAEAIAFYVLIIGKS